MAIWFTGLSGSGKTTVSKLVEQRLRAQGVATVRLDGDELRAMPGWALGFSAADRMEQARRLGTMALEHCKAGRICLVAAISPFASARDEARARIGSFLEIYCRASVAVLAEHDVKGLYAKALAGQISAFTGISSPYEAPENAEVVLQPYAESPERSAARVIAGAYALARLRAREPAGASETLEAVSG